MIDDVQYEIILYDVYYHFLIKALSTYQNTLNHSLPCPPLSKFCPLPSLKVGLGPTGASSWNASWCFGPSSETPFLGRRKGPTGVFALNHLRLAMLNPSQGPATPAPIYGNAKDVSKTSNSEVAMACDCSE